MANPVDNIPPEKRGNPAWVKGGGSPNPGGRPRRLVEVEAMLDAEFRDVASIREAFTVLRKLALQGVTNDVYTKDGALCGEKTTHHPAYMQMLFDRLLGPVKEVDVDLSNVSPEALAELRGVLKQ